MRSSQFQWYLEVRCLARSTMCFNSPLDKMLVHQIINFVSALFNATGLCDSKVPRMYVVRAQNSGPGQNPDCLTVAHSIL